MKAFKLALWLLVGLAAVAVLVSSDFRGDDLVGLLQGLLLCGLLAVAVLLRWTITFHFWSSLVAWLRRGLR